MRRQRRAEKWRKKRRRIRRSMCPQGLAQACTVKKATLIKTAKSLQVQALTTICALALMRRIMEPGGFEPPCRDGRHAASTCVVAIYSRPAGRLATTFLQAMADECLAPQRPASPLKPVRCFVQCPIGRQSLNVAVKPRGRTGCCQIQCCILDNAGEMHPRHATSYVPRPVDASRPRWVVRSIRWEPRCTPVRGPRSVWRSTWLRKSGGLLGRRGIVPC